MNIMKAMQVMKPMTAMKSMKAKQAIKPMTAMKSMKAMQAIKPMNAMKSMKAMRAIKPMKAMRGRPKKEEDELVRGYRKMAPPHCLNRAVRANLCPPRGGATVGT